MNPWGRAFSSKAPGQIGAHRCGCAKNRSAGKWPAEDRPTSMPVAGTTIFAPDPVPPPPHRLPCCWSGTYPPRFDTSLACAEIHTPGIQPVDQATINCRARRRIITCAVDSLSPAATQNFRLFPRYLSPDREPPRHQALLQPHKQKRRVSRETRRPFPANRPNDQAVFFANPRYVSITRGFCASSAAGPSSANSPVSST